MTVCYSWPSLATLRFERGTVSDSFG